MNFAVWLERAAPGFFWLGVTAGFAAYALRRMRVEADGSAPGWWLGVGLGVLAVGLGGWWRGRGRFFRVVDARGWLEYRLGLHSRLSAAAAGVADWPPVQAVPTTVSWRAPGTFAWLGAAGGLALAGWLMPVPGAAGLEYARAVEKSPALAEAEAWLEQLAEQAVARPEDVAKMSEQANGLGERTPEERYSHSGLEAADTLRTQTAEAIRGLGANLEAAAAALEPFERAGGTRNDAEQGAVVARLGEALRGLQEGPLAAGEALQAKLGEAAAAAGKRSLSPEQAAQLKQQLARAGRAATGVLGAQGQGASVATADPDAPVRFGPGGKGAGAGSGEGDEVGSGGVQRGPGHAPLWFRDEASTASPGKNEAVGGDDFGRAALGELLAMERGEHEFSPRQTGAPSAAGAVAAPAQGGDVVWVERLTPGERAALKDFFK
ncbi:MAG: hypothetical protein NTU80_05080 [Verrucomicrobia bacterium]|nr:hypothetical protein [Verrucomicrobiota bacterium]